MAWFKVTAYVRSDEDKALQYAEDDIHFSIEAIEQGETANCNVFVEPITKEEYKSKVFPNHK